MKLLLSILALCSTLGTFAQGTSEAILGYTGSIGGFVSGTAGWTFQAAANLTATQLGCFAYVFESNPTVASIQVGLWAPNGALLASNTITPSSALINQSRYESVTPVALVPGQIYSIGIYTLGIGIGLDVAGVAADGTISSTPSIFLRGAATAASGFAYPPEVSGTLGSIYAGPNFRYQGGVPEPSSWVLLSLGGLALVARRKTRRPCDRQ